VSSPRDSRGVSASTTSSYANRNERNSTHTGADVSLPARFRSFFDEAVLFIETPLSKSVNCRLNVNRNGQTMAGRRIPRRKLRYAVFVELHQRKLRTKFAITGQSARAICVVFQERFATSFTARLSRMRASLREKKSHRI